MAFDNLLPTPLMRRIFHLFVFLLALGVVPVSAQTAQHVPGEILVQYAPGADIRTIESDLAMLELDDSRMLTTGLKLEREISAPLRIWLLSFDHDVPEKDMLATLRNHPAISLAQFNHIVSDRAVPSDPQYGNQWQYDNDGTAGSGAVVDGDIDAPEAWDLTTGGFTTQGDRIVVCVIDEGYNTSHPDLAPNIWVNTSEIPGNGIDDDGNGFVDDINGWNAYSSNGNINAGGSHGNPVAGIIGAKGNNGIGVAGVNWDVGLMLVRGSSGVESTVLEAYSYPLAMRKLYNSSNGTQGAFVVSTNASFGVDFGQPADAPLWCAMYDSLGKAGITSCAATINGNYNVDVIGDLPTACPSPHLISVTNLTWDDQKVTGAGYGATTIDIGSFGAGTHTITTTGYGGFGGTSGATPHVAGAIALAYSASCEDFINLAKTDPEAASLAVKQYVLDGGDPNTSLAGITTSGNRQNLRGMLDELLVSCGVAPSCDAPVGMISTVNGPNSATVSWSSVATADAYQVQGRKVGTSSWRSKVTYTNSFTVNTLEGDNDYEWQVRARCGDGSLTPWSAITTFQTSACPVYCPTGASNATEEWIEEIMFNGVLVNTGSNGGYVNFGLTPAFNWSIGETVNFSLTQGFAGATYPEWFRVYIDWNTDGDFDDAGERVYDQGTTSTSTVFGTFSVPATALSGTTGMRVQMRYNTGSDPCEFWTFGEVEDYCVVINPVPREGQVEAAMNASPNPATEVLRVDLMSPSQVTAPVTLTDLLGRVVASRQIELLAGQNSMQLDVMGLAPGIYLLNAEVTGNLLQQKVVIE